PRIDELLQLSEAAVTDAAGDVIRGGRRAKARSTRRLPERHRPPRLIKTLDLLGELEIDVRVQQHVVLVAQLPGADVLIAHVGVGDMALVERVARPPGRIGIRPRYPHAKARHRSVMLRYLRDGGGARKIQPELCGGRVHRVRKTGLRRKYPGAGRV